VIVLDTDIVIDVLRGRREVITKLAKVSPDDVAVTTMTVAELLYGALGSREPAKNRAEVVRLVNAMRTVPFGRRAAALHAQLRDMLRQKPSGPNDLVIAATTLSVDATLVTANTREFERVAGLRVESWR
jgi:tRNA(fMet)-specific endonuclease VapC